MHDADACDVDAKHLVSDLRQRRLHALAVRVHADAKATKITVVTHANGVDFLMEGAKDANGGAFAGPVAALVARGVVFEVCEITLKNRNLKKDQFIQEANFTPSGVVRISKLQLAGQAYIKP